MTIQWNDEDPKKFLIHFGIKHKKLRKCLEAAKRLQYKTVHIDDIDRKNYTIYTAQLKKHSEILKMKLKVGTLFCRQKDNGRWFLKDGNHRFLVLVINGETEVRIAYDPKNEI